MRLGVAVTLGASIAVLAGCARSEAPREGGESAPAASPGGGGGGGSAQWRTVGNPRGMSLEADLGSMTRRGDTVRVAARVITDRDTIPREWEIACATQRAKRDGQRDWQPIRPESLVGMIAPVVCEGKTP